MYFKKNEEQIAGMNFIKKHFLKKYIAERKAVRSVDVVSLQRAKSVGLLCNITTEDTYKEIYEVFASLQAANRYVWLLGYIDDKIVPFYCLQQLSADYFCNKDLTWYGKPEKVQVDDFLKTDFDILIDFSNESSDIFELILSLSRAHFIVGAHQEYSNYYDLLIQTEKPMEHWELLKNITYYTQQLKGESL